MADVESNIRINIDTSSALGQLRLLQREISAFQQNMLQASAAQAKAARQQQDALLSSINALRNGDGHRQFAARTVSVTSATERFTRALETNKLTMGEYFKYGMGATKSFGRFFATEHALMEKVARERVKTLQTQYIKLGRDANGALQAIKVRPLQLDLQNLATQTAINAQRQQLFNQLLKQGSTSLLNFGKNTQWAGRQLMVGFTIPLTYLGGFASKTFMDMEKQALRFKRVYGELFTTQAETDQMVKQVADLAKEFTKYGIAIEQTVGLAADVAAMGKMGADLLAQVSEATRLAVLGGVEQEQALETTISITNAFGIASDKLAGKIDFLNAVENQTVTSIEDLTTAIPKAGPVIQQLGGDVEDLAFFLTAMKEGGINASEGANALKSGLASMINPTEKASKMLLEMGINLKEIVTANKGDVKATVIEFAQALDTLNPLNRAKAIEQLFGKFQFARLSTLFQNVIAEGTQANRVLELTNATSAELAILSQRELKRIEDSPMYKFKKSIEDLKASLIPLGEEFIKLVTPIVKFGTSLLENFNKLDSGTRTFVTGLVTVLGGIAPVALMAFGLVANGAANMIKFFGFLFKTFQRTSDESRLLGHSTDYLTQQQLESLAVAASLDANHSKLIQTFTAEKASVDQLSAAYRRAISAQNAFLAKPIQTSIGKTRRGMADGGMVRGPGGPKDDLVPVNLSNGEAVIDAATVDKNPRIIAALFAGKKINIPGYAENNSRTFVGKQMNLPGGSHLSHFSEPSYKTGAELLELAKESKATESELNNLRQMIGKDLNRTFKVFDSRVERLSEELNRLVGDFGSGKTVPKSLVQRDLVERGRDARMPLIDRLVRSNVSQEEAVAKADKVTAQIKRNLDNLGDSVNLTLEDISRITSDSYEEIAKKDKEVKAAYEDMKKIETYTDPTTGRGAQGQRRSFGKGYIKQRERIKRNASQFNATAYGSSAFKTTKEMETISKLSSLEIQARFKSLTDEQKVRVHAELKKGTQQFIDALFKETGVVFVDGIKKATRQQSPSKEAYNAGRNIGIGAIQGIESQIPKSKAIGSQFFGKSVPIDQRAKSQAMLYPGITNITSQDKAARRQAEKVAKRQAREQKQLVAQRAKQKPTLGQRVSGGVKNIGSKISAGFGKMKANPLGATMGIGMAGMAVSMIPGMENIGMGISALSMLPMLIGMLSNPIGIAVAAIGALTAGFIFLNQEIEKNKKEQRALANAASTSQVEIEKMSEDLGTVSATQARKAKLDETILGINQEQITAGKQFITDTASGQKLLEDVKLQIANGISMEEISTAISSKLGMAVSQGVMEADMASSIISAIGASVGESKISSLAQSQFNQYASSISGMQSSQQKRLQQQTGNLKNITLPQDDYIANLQQNANQMYTDQAIGIGGRPIAIKDTVQAANIYSEIISGFDVISKAFTDKTISEAQRLQAVQSQIQQQNIAFTQAKALYNQGTMLATAEDRFTKDSAEYKTINKLTKLQGNQDYNQDLIMRMQLDVLGGVMSPEVAQWLFDTMKNNKPMQTTMNVAMKTFGSVEATTLMANLQLTGKDSKEIQRIITVAMQSKDPNAAKDLNNVLGTIDTLNKEGANIDISGMDLTDTKKIKELSQDLTDLDSLFANGKIKYNVLAKTEGFEDLKTNAKWFNDLPASEQKEYLARYTIIQQTITDDEVKMWKAGITADFARANPVAAAAMMKGIVVDSQMRSDFAAEMAAQGLGEGKGGKGGGKGSNGEGISALAKKVIAAYEKQVKAIQKKRDALKEVNEQLARQKAFEDAQQQRINDMKQAFITGDYLKAAMLKQNMMYEQAKYDRETTIQEYESKIDALEQRISELRGGSKVNQKDKAFIQRSVGGMVTGYNIGGFVQKPQYFNPGGFARGKDTIPAMLAEGEFVQRASAVSKYGVDFMKSVNNGTYDPGASYSDSVYNVSMTINGDGADAREIADIVIRKLNTLSTKNNKSNRVI